MRDSGLNETPSMEWVVPLRLGEGTHKYEALYQSLREAILGGRLKEGARLPSTRRLAAVHGISRGTVNQVYEMLAADGYVVTSVGSGTYVSFRSAGEADAGGRIKPALNPLGTDSLVTDSTGTKPLGSNSRKANHPATVNLSQWGARLMQQSPAQRSPTPTGSISGDNGGGIHFHIGMPDLAQFPLADWQRAMKKAMRDAQYVLDPSKAAAKGLLPLREAITQHLARTRGMSVEAEQVFIVNGSLQAIGLLVHLLINTGDAVMVENPSYKGTRDVIKAVGGIPVPLALDGEGVQVPDQVGRMLFVTPSHQFPTGVVLGQQRRLQLLEWANRHNAIIVEDDYDSEFRRKGRPIDPLKVLDYQGRVVYVGTFSKTLSPSLRIGYAVLPDRLQEPFSQAKKLFEPSSSSLLEQMTIAEFIKKGSYARHLRKMIRVYSQKHDTLKSLFDHYLPGTFEWTESEAGLHLFGWWTGHGGCADRFVRFQQLCEGLGVTWFHPEKYFLKSYRPCAMFGFSHLMVDQMERALKKMSKVYGRC